MTRPRVAILGGGMAGLTTAWELSQGDWRQDLESITVYQRGWRLGGKGASSRGVHDRIEEHGLHVLLGYYDATFRVLREAYGELDRPRTDPDCPIRTWQDAFAPSRDVGLADSDGQSWGHFVTRFSTNDLLPGEPGAEDRPLRPLDVAARSLRLLMDFHRSMDQDPTPGVYLSASPEPRPQRAADLATLVRGGGLTALAAVLAATERAARASGDPRLPRSAVDALASVLWSVRAGLAEIVAIDPGARRTWELIDLVAANLQGMLVDGLLSGSGFERIDHLDYREWLALHGAAPQTSNSAIVRGMYDLTFAYEAADKRRPQFAAGLGLQLAARMLFDFKGSIFWRMQAGMGEAVFAPMYQALARRGVTFRFFHRLDRLEAAAPGAIGAIHLTQQAGLAPGRADYDPLVPVDSLPCWPDRPRSEQLDRDPGALSESHQWTGPGSGSVTLVAGRDFDVAVLAVSLGMVPHVAADLMALDPAWQRMVEGVSTVATRAAQLWMGATEAELGWTGQTGVTLSGYGATFDTWASMTHLLPRESWPADGPRSLAYLCSAMPDTDPAAGLQSVRESVVHFLEQEVGVLWPAAPGPAGFRWELLWDGEGRAGSRRLDAHYLRANLDPSDRYVQSLPGSGRHRIAPGSTGFGNLAVAGDWTACGLDAGCVEAAARSGLQAARAIRSGSVRGARQGAGR